MATRRPTGAPKTRRTSGGIHPARIKRSQFPREIHWRYLEAYLADLGNRTKGMPRDVHIAKAIGLRRETLYRWRRRFPQFSEWVAEQVKKQTGALGPAVVRACAERALRGGRGADRYADLFLRASGVMTTKVEVRQPEPTRVIHETVIVPAGGRDKP